MNQQTKGTCHPQIHILLHTWWQAAWLFSVVSEAFPVNMGMTVVFALMKMHLIEAGICHPGRSFQI